LLHAAEGAGRAGIEDVLKEVPLSAVLKERIALADQKYESAIQQINDLKKKVATLERENADLRAQIPRHKETSLPEDTARVLVQIFRANDIEVRVPTIADTCSD
jgi:cell division protein FtsB